MRNSIKEKFNKLQEILDEDISLLALLFLEKKEEVDDLINNANDISECLGVIYQYGDIRFGDVEFWTEEELFNDKQFNIMFYSVPKPEEWMCIGEVQPYPILVNKQRGIVTCVISEPGMECEMKEYGQIDEFIDKFVLGKRYLELGTDEDWYEFMKTHRII